MTAPLSLRWYQSGAIDALWNALRAGVPAPVACLPTGAGKGPCCSSICRTAVQQWGGRVLVLVHVKELVAQLAEAIRRDWGSPMCPLGVLSAGLGSRSIDQVTVAGIQTAYRRSTDIGPRDICVIDECFPAGTPIATPHGDIPIERLKPGSSVLTAVGAGTVMATSARPSRTLVKVHLSNGQHIACTSGHRFFTSTGWEEAEKLAAGACVYGIQGMSILWQGLSPVDQPVGKVDEGEIMGQTTVLLDILLKEAGEPDGIAGHPSKNAEDAHEDATCSDPTWGERKAAAARSFGVAARAWSGVDRRGNSDDRHIAGERNTAPLQARHCEPGFNDCDRGGRNDAYAIVDSRGGHEKGELPGVVRVVGVSCVESVGDVPVYNLHVSGHPSYFAHGILVHNCHLIPESGEGMYRTLLNELRVINPNMRILGLTATPYRLGHGLIYGEGKVFSDLVYDAGIKPLIEEGFLSRLRSKDAGAPDLSQVHMRGGEYIIGELETAMADEDKVKHAVAEMLRHGSDRKAWLVFCCGVKHATMVSDHLTAAGIDNAVVTGDTPGEERDALIARFKAGGLRCLVNITVLTTGFDAPHIDLVAMLRPTESPGLYYQMMGRGLRIHPDKKDCIVLDMAGNIQRHGPIDTLNERIMAPKTRKPGDGKAPTKRCDNCEEVVPAAARVCPECGYTFPPPEVARHDTVADTTSPISNDAEPYWIDHITAVQYEAWTKKGAGEHDPKTLCVSYYQGMLRVAREWVCVEHPIGGFAQQKAWAWIQQRIEAPGLLTIAPDDSCMVLETPDGERCLSAADAADIGGSGLFAEPSRIQVKPDGKYTSIVGYDFAARAIKRASAVPVPDDEPPF